VNRQVNLDDFNQYKKRSTTPVSAGGRAWRQMNAIKGFDDLGTPPVAWTQPIRLPL
jgi:hypothetical protein